MKKANLIISIFFLLIFPNGVHSSGVPDEPFLRMEIGMHSSVVITIAPFNLMFRYNKARFQPYVGVGPAIFLSRIKTTEVGFEGTQSSTKVGLNVKLGGEYFFTEHISGYGEVRYNYTRFDFDATEAGGFGFTATYNPVIFSFGVGYHF